MKGLSIALLCTVVAVNAHPSNYYDEYGQYDGINEYETSYYDGNPSRLYYEVTEPEPEEATTPIIEPTTVEPEVTEHEGENVYTDVFEDKRDSTINNNEYIIFGPEPKLTNYEKVLMNEDKSESVEDIAEKANEYVITSDPKIIEYIEEPVREELIVSNCTDLEHVKDNSVKTIITTAEQSHSCIDELIRVSDSTNGTVIVVGSDKSANLLAALKLYRQSTLFYNKYYVLPQSIQRLRQYIYDPNEMDIKAFVTANQITEQLQAFIRDDNYEEALNLSKYLYDATFDASGKKVLRKTVEQLLEKNDYTVMNYAFKLIKGDAKHIVDDCFPTVFKQIFDGDGLNILDKEGKGELRLSAEADSINDRWLYSDCSDESSLQSWTFNPIWNATLNKVMFEIKNTLYGMKLKLNWETIGLYNSERVAWGDLKEVDPFGRFEWRLNPAGFSENGDPMFCFVEEVYNSCLMPNTCKQPKEDVVGNRVDCSSEVGWIMKPNNYNEPYYQESSYIRNRLMNFYNRRNYPSA